MLEEASCGAARQAAADRLGHLRAPLGVAGQPFVTPCVPSVPLLTRALARQLGRRNHNSEGDYSKLFTVQDDQRFGKVTMAGPFR